jgi:hypothetical protein
MIALVAAAIVVAVIVFTLIGLWWVDLQSGWEDDE